MSDQELKPQARRAGRIRLLALLGLSATALVVAISCQSVPSGVGFQDSPTDVGNADPNKAHNTTLPSTVPAGLDPNGRPITQGMRELGFTFTESPAEAQPAEVISQQNKTCVACHIPYRPGATQEPGIADADTFHARSIGVSCIDCHGGHVNVAGLPDEPPRADPRYDTWKKAAHVTPRRPELWKDGSAAKPQILFATTVTESADYVRFINPGAPRAAHAACAPCHREQTDNVASSMMAHGAMLWEAALYNNGAINRKAAIYGEFYGPSDKDPALGAAVARVDRPLPTTRQLDQYGMLPALYPLPRWEITQPGNVLRVFERGAKFRPVIGEPDKEEDSGKPDVKLSLRGFGTDVRTDPVFIGLQKTRLLDPTLNNFGTNDHAGDYRSSGCSACHVVYANDRSPLHSSFWAGYGNRGQSFSSDPTVNPASKASTQPADVRPYDDPWAGQSDRERGHPIKHVMVRNMPTSSCIVCHIHPGTNVLMSYLGTLWWDNESDGALMYPRDQKNPTSDEEFLVNQHNPEGSAVRGLWSDMYPNSVNHKGERAGSDFLEKLGVPATQPGSVNSKMTRMQFADFHGHGWVFRGVYKQDRKGNMLDYKGDKVPTTQPEELAQKMGEAMNFYSPKPDDHPPAGAPVHLKDIHLERGMQCVDCHFETDNHGNGHLYGETRAAVTIDCVDCHGSIEEPAYIFQYLKSTSKNSPQAKDLLARAFSGNASRGIERDKLIARNRDAITAHFAIKAGKLYQKSAMYDAAQKQNVPAQQMEKPNVPQGWTVVQTVSTNVPTFKPAIPDPDPTRPRKRRSEAHTVTLWDPPKTGSKLAHGSQQMSCYACHSSWNTSCFGCHLPQKANQRKPMLHNDAIFTRNYTNYNYQTLRDDVYMLGIDGTTRDHKVVPIRSACAVLVSSQDGNRQWIYGQQQTVSAEGFSGQAFSPYFPHTVRSAETKSCGDCHVHVDKDGHVDNNAVMAQLLLQGTNAFNFIGRFAWVAEGEGGLEAVRVTERDEPQAVIGSTLHELAYPDNYRKHVENGRSLDLAHEHTGNVLDVQLRGEYLYAACAEDGFIAYDVANVDNKGLSERITKAPVSPLGQRFYIKSKYATAICSPSTLALDPTRPHLKVTQKLVDASGTITERTVMPNEEQDVHLFYAFLYLTDKEEGLIVIGNPLDSPNKAGVATLLDGDPDNNFLERAVTYNPGGLLKGARSIATYGTYAYIACDAGLVCIDLNDPLHPRLVSLGGISGLNHPRKVQFQFRYGFVCDDDGVKVLDLTFPEDPKLVNDKDGKPVVVPIPDARDIYIARTWGFVAAGKQGVVVLDLEKPEVPRKMSVEDGDFPSDFNAAYRIEDTNAVRFAMTNASMFLYVADGHHGLKVLQLTSPEYTPTYLGFAPKLEPRLVSWRHTEGPCLAISEGLDRDRAVDESGHQLSVFGRRGARPFNKAEQERLYLRGDPGSRVLWTVDEDPNDESVIAPKPSTPPKTGATGPRTGPPPPSGTGPRPPGAAPATPPGGAGPKPPPPRRPTPPAPGANK